MAGFRKTIAALAACICILTACAVYASRPAGSSPGGELLLALVVPVVAYSILEE